MKIIFNLLLFFFPIFCSAQEYGMMNMKKNDASENYHSTYQRRKSSTVYKTEDLFLGYQNVNFNSLNSTLFHGSGNVFSSNMIVFGIDGEVFPLGKMGVTNFIEFTSFQSVTKYQNDTNYTLTGWQGHFMHFGLDVFPGNKNVDWTFLGGFEYGRLKLTRTLTTNGDKTIYTNPLFALNLSSELHFNIFPFRNEEKGFGIGARAGYDVDLSNSKWINKSGGLSGLPGTSLSGYYYSLMIVFYH